MWTIGLGLACRIVGLAGTIVITRYLSPAVMGEVATAMALAMTANWMTAWGFNQYVIVRGGEGPDAIFPATVLHLVLGLAGLLAMLVGGVHLAGFLNAPNLGVLLPGLVLAVAIKRVASMPDKLLMRQMRFRTVAIANAAGEAVYVALAVLLVVNTTLGGLAIVVANIAQALVVATIEIWAQGLRSWLTPAPWRWRRVRDILVFGAPLGLESFLHEASRYWDKVAFSRLFGPQATGMYSLAYNLADLPAAYVGEHVGSVLFPTLVHSSPADRPRLFSRAFGLLLLVVLPIAVGLAAVAHTLVELLLAPDWQPVADFLVVLAAAGIFRPINVIAFSLLMASERNVPLMWAEFGKVSTLLLGMWVLAPLGEIASAASVALALGLQAALLVHMLGRFGFPARDALRSARGPAAAAAMLLLGVFAVRWAVHPLALPAAIRLFLEVAAGAIAYAAGAWLFARETAVAAISLVRSLRQAPRPSTGL